MSDERKSIDEAVKRYNDIRAKLNAFKSKSRDSVDTAQNSASESG